MKRAQKKIRMKKYFIIYFLFLSTLHATWGQQYITQTVYGFLDFTTTIGNTVMVFSPQSSAPETTPTPPAPEKSIIVRTESTHTKNQIPEIKPSKTITVVTKEYKPKNVVSTVVQSHEVSPKKEQKPIVPEKKKLSSKVEIVVVKETNKPVLPQSPKIEIHTQIESNVLIEADNSPAIAVANDLVEPEYDFLAREPSEFAEETYRVTNLKPTHRLKDHHDKKRQQSQSKDVIHPTGLVTKLGGTIVKDGATTVHETSVIGTYISGKYAQVLQSSSKVFKKPPPKISTTPTLRILKTAAPAPPPPVKYRAESTQSAHDDDNSNGRSNQRRTGVSSNFKARPRKPTRDEHENVATVNASTGPTTSIKSNRNRNKLKHRRSKSTRTAHKSPSTIVAASTASVVAAENSYSRRAFKPRIQASIVEPSQHESTSLYKFKLNRSPGRWQYKTSPKPRVTIRKSNLDDPAESNGNAEVLSNDIPIGNANTRNDDTDLDSSGSINSGVLNDLDSKSEKSDNKKEKKLLVETLKVEISTPANFKDTYYEIATIKTPFTFQVGTVKNTRYITVTSTMEKTLDPEPTATTTLTEPLMENILTSSNRYLDQSLLDSSIITLSPLHLSNDEETPALETTIETFSTTQEILRTQILPVVTNETKTSIVTLVQTYHITRLTTATKTLAPLEVYHRYKDFNGKLEEAGSEINLELDFGDDNENDEDAGAVKRLPPELDIGMIGADFDLIDVRQGEQIERRSKPSRHTNKNQNKDSLTNNLSAEQLQQLALLKLLNPQAQIPQVITTSKPVLKLQTLYESHVIPIINGQTTGYSTISKIIGTVTKTELEYGTSTINQLPIPPVPLNPINQINPLFQQQQQQQQFHVTSAPMVTQTVVTQTQSKVLKLTFGAKTAYTTLFSTNVVPTVLTTFVTTTIPVQPTAAFQGYYPAPFAPYPYVG